MPLGSFSNDESHILRKIWEDLSERADYIGIDADTFLKYIPISGLLGERLFEKFDTQGNGFVTFEDFISGLSILCLGTMIEQTKFLFDVCDVNHDGLIPKQNLITILNYIPKDIFCNHCNIRTRTRTLSRSPPALGRTSDLPPLSRSPAQSSTNLAGFVDNQTETINFIEYTNSCVCDGAFVHHKDVLDYDDFNIWLKHTPAILGYIKSVIPCMAEDNLLVSNSSNKPLLWKKGEKTGFMLKRYYVLCGSCLYYYQNKGDARPKGVIFLSGSIIQRVEDPEMSAKGYWGFEILQQNLCADEHEHHHHHHEKRIFYCQTQSECDNWIHKLQHLSNVVPFEEEYEIGVKIGTGAFSEVFECTHKTSGEKYAVKIIDKDIFDRVDKTHLRNEIAILKLVNHPNVIYLKYTCEDKEKIYIVTELIKDGDFLDFLVGKPRFKEDDLKPIIKQLLEAVAYLHEFGIVHCDIKPENILYDKITGNIIKLTDFGLSRMIFSNQKIDEVCGTISYVAPEALAGMGHGMESDLWSVGIIMYLMTHGRLPFDDENNDVTIKQILCSELEFKNTLSDNATEILSLLLEKNPKKRITAKDALLHPFFL